MIQSFFDRVVLSNMALHFNRYTDPKFAVLFMMVTSFPYSIVIAPPSLLVHLSKVTVLSYWMSMAMLLHYSQQFAQYFQLLQPLLHPCRLYIPVKSTVDDFTFLTKDSSSWFCSVSVKYVVPDDNVALCSINCSTKSGNVICCLHCWQNWKWTNFLDNI